MSNNLDPYDADRVEMGTGPSLIDSAAADRMLDGYPGHDGPPALRRLLAAAAAPATRQELGGEQAAIMAFRRAARGRDVTSATWVPIPRRRRTGRLRRLFTIPVGIAAAAAVALAGAALAATGVVPFPFPSFGEPPSPTPVSQTTTLPTPGESRGNGPLAPGTSNPAVSSEALPGLCRAYLARETANPDKEENGASFEELSRLAGGPERVVGFCNGVLASNTPGNPHGTPPAGPDTSHTPNPNSNQDAEHKPTKSS